MSIQNERLEVLRTIRARVKEAREYLGLSHDFVAEQLDLLRVSYTQRETGAVNFTVDDLAILSRLLRRPIVWFYGETAPIPEEPSVTHTLNRLSTGDQEAVRKFAEFLHGAGKPPRISEKDED